MEAALLIVALIEITKTTPTIFNIFIAVFAIQIELLKLKNV
jgi:hypothetical protein